MTVRNSWVAMISSCWGASLALVHTCAGILTNIKALVWTFLAELLCVQIHLHLLSHYTEEKRRQMAFSYFLLTLYAGIIFRSNSSLFSGHTWLPFALQCCCCCWAISSHIPFSSGFWLASASLTLRRYVATSWYGVQLTSCICVSENI